jgi:plasmid stabilization system protein ParE
MRVEWTKDAIRQKDQVAEYVRQQFGYKRKRKFVQDVDKAARMLMRSPYIGQIDPLFEGHAATYRSVIVNGLNKMVYRIDGEVIYIAAFWDTRMEPEEQAARV